MIVEVEFDVDGATAADLQAEALAQMEAFDPRFEPSAWTITIRATVRARDGFGVPVMWTGEVVARLHANAAARRA